MAARAPQLERASLLAARRLALAGAPLDDAAIAEERARTIVGAVSAGEDGATVGDEALSRLLGDRSLRRCLGRKVAEIVEAVEAGWSDEDLAELASGRRRPPRAVAALPVRSAPSTVCTCGETAVHEGFCSRCLTRGT